MDNTNLAIVRPIFKVGCASIGKIMTESHEKSAKQKLADLETDFVATLAKIAELRTKSAGKSDEAEKCTEKQVSAKAKFLDAVEKLNLQVAVLQNKLDVLKLAKKSYLEIIENRNDVCLSSTCKSYLHNWVIRKKYGKTKGFSSEQTEKGNEVEQNSIDFLNFFMLEEFQKNEKGFENDFLRGIPDILEGIDIKSSYNYNTFFDAKISELNTDYFWQAQGYMAFDEFAHLQKWDIVYCCVNTPSWIVDKEIRKSEYKKGWWSPLFETEKEEIRNSHNFDDIPMHKRIHTFTIERDDEAIERIYQRVLDCRIYINQIWDLC